MSMSNWTSPRSLSALILSVVAVSGCTTSTQFVDYQEQRLYSGDNAGGMDYVEIGPATASSSGYVWESCEAIQQEALQTLRNEADQHGANTVFDVHWVNHSEGAVGDTPLCTTRWGWFAGFGVAGLGPWVKVTEVRGKLAYMDASSRDELNASADSYQAQLNEQDPKDSEEAVSDADNNDSEKTGEDAAETSAAADEAETSEETATTDSESSSEASNPEARETPEESDAEAEADDDAQDENGQDDNSNADEQSNSS